MPERASRVVIVIVGFLLASFAEQGFARSDSQTCPSALSARHSVLRLMRGSRTVGAGFIYRQKDVLVTAEHVAETRPDSAVDMSGRRYALGPRIRDRARDVAVYRLTEPVSLAPLPAAPPVVVGSTVFAIGHPRPPRLSRAKHRLTALDWSISRGSITGTSDDWVVSDVTVYPGNSGGPLVSCDGRVVGIGSHAAQDLRFVWYAAIETANRLLATGRDGSLALPRDPEPLHWELAFQVGRNRQTGLALWLHWPAWRHLQFSVGMAASTNLLSGDIFAVGQQSSYRSTLLATVPIHLLDRWNFDPVVLISGGFTFARYRTLRPAIDGTNTLVSTSERERVYAATTGLQLALETWRAGGWVDINVQRPKSSVWWFSLGRQF